MCNCGNKRNEYATVSRQSSFSQPKNEALPTPEIWQDTYFEYVGKTALTVTGNASGKRYRFNEPGAKQLIDQKDAPGMTKVPVLKRIAD